ncbi:hypothetical protein [Thalassotalea ganghwensis]
MALRKKVKLANHHQLPHSLLSIINEFRGQNVVGFGRNRQQQLECLLKNLLNYQSESFKQQLKKELLAYYQELSEDVINR